MKKLKKKEEKGITLVALVVTIIVLLILAGVTLNIVLDNDGIINKAQQAVGDYENSQREEQEILNEIENYMNSQGGSGGVATPTPTPIPSAPIPVGYTKSQITTEDDIAEGLVIYEIPEGATVNWTDNEDSNGKNQSTIILPGETDEKNLQESVNQYVWIPVDNINDMVMCSSNSGSSVCNLIYNENTNTLTCQTHTDTPTELVGRLYIGTLSDTTDGDGNIIYSYTMDFMKRDQTYSANSGNREPAIVTGNNLGDGTSYDGDSSNLKIAGMPAGSTAEQFLTQLKNDFTVMVKSVAKNGGFYISRYEVGANGDSKKNQQVLTADSSDGTDYLGANKWYGLYNTIKDETKHKQMIWGCQYDQVIKFLKENGEAPENGHSDRNLTIDHALSGQNEQDCMRNIYDLEGNHAEWTAEASSTDFRADRGSYYTMRTVAFSTQQVTDGTAIRPVSATTVRPAPHFTCSAEMLVAIQ